MKKLVLLAIYAASAGCTSSPPVYTSVFDAVNRQHAYVQYTAKDYRPMGPGEGGNCARFAATYKQALAEVGVKSYIMACYLDGGQGHAFTMTSDGWVLDNRQRWEGKYQDVGCRTN